MQEEGQFHSRKGLGELGIANVGTIWWNLTTPALYEHAVRRREGSIAHLGPLVVRTGHHTGRSPDDKFIVRQPPSDKKIWWGKVNRPFDPEAFNRLYHRILAYLQGKDIFIQDCFAGADPAYRIPIRIITETAWHNLFARNLFIQASHEELQIHEPQFTVLNVPNFHADPQIDGTNSDVFIIINFERRIVLIGGTHYAGEIKKSIFSILNYIFPQMGVLTMHASVNRAKGDKEDPAIFFGLSGTGKTTLSSDPERVLIGDDEHGWSEEGLFNFEGGCYAKVIRLSPEEEPEIYEATRKFGTILENVAMDPLTRRLDLNDSTLTENTRAAYPISHIPNADRRGRCSHPKTIIMLTADAFGVLPPVSRLTTAQAMFHFLSGYTAKVAGTEKGVTEPQATFSTCFGAPFMVLEPTTYARMLREKIVRHDVSVWLINTGWINGPYGVGSRISIRYTRAIVRSVIGGALEDVEKKPDPIFGLLVPVRCPGIPDEILQPRNQWRDKREYDLKARELAKRFVSNFEEFLSEVPEDVRDARPNI
jgi:phosphoenolpyruvate carboxykinase (ATP)